MKQLLTLVILMICFFHGKSQTCSSGLSGLYKIGPSGNYNNITNALIALKNNGVNSNVILELQATYSSASEIFPLQFNGIGCLSNTRNLTIRPESGATNLTISGSPSTTLIDFSDARYIKIDGRPGGTAALSQLRIISLTQSATVFRFEDDASFNTLSYLTIKGARIGKEGQVYFGTSSQTITNGNNDNKIVNCSFSYDAFNPNFSIICSEGSDNKKNKNNQISNCNFSSFNNTAVSLQKNSEAWLLDGNSFYAFGGAAPIVIDDTSAAGFSIVNNFIGGSAPGCGGNALQLTNSWSGIHLNTSANGITSIQNNTISNIKLKITNGTSFVGIRLINGKFRCGDIEGNTIGSQTANANIQIEVAGGVLHRHKVYGIYAEGGRKDSLLIKNNKISGIAAFESITTTSYLNLTAIHTTIQSNEFADISNNFIGSQTLFNSISNRTNGGENLLYGIEFSSGIGPTTNVIISGNHLSNLEGTCIGIRAGGKMIIKENKIKGLSSPIADVMGIFMSSPVAGSKVYGNSISFISALNYATGIHAAGAGVLFDKNTLHTFHTAITAIGIVKHIGLNIVGGEHRVQNNMIRLGIDSTGGSSAGNPEIIGINLDATNCVISNNSVYIGGVGDGESSAFKTYSVTPGKIVNNIFANARSATSAATTFIFHAAFRYTNTLSHLKNIPLNHNIYHAPGTRGVPTSNYPGGVVITGNYTTIEDWRNATGLDSNSFFTNPNYLNPAGNAASFDLHLAALNPAEGQGLSDPEISDDFDGNVRSNFTPDDIGADAGNFSLRDGDAPVLTHSKFIGQSFPSTFPYAIKITDNGGGIDTTVNKPRIWFRKKHPSISNWASSPGYYISGNLKNSQWGFVPDLAATGSSFVAGDSVEYYFVAQDKGLTPNIGYSNTKGTLHTNVFSQITAPVTPLRLLIYERFADSIFVGAGQLYTSLTNNGGFFEASKSKIFQSQTPVVCIVSDLAESGTHIYTSILENGPLIRIVTNTPVIKEIKNTSNLAKPMVVFQNAYNLIVDGSVNGTGKFLRLTNGHSQPNSCQSTFLLNGKVADITVQHVIFQSNSNYNIGPVVNINTGDLRRVRFQKNVITNIESGANAGLPATALSVSLHKSDSVVIRDNDITNFTLTGIAGLQNNTIGSGKIIIDSNHFYQNSGLSLPPQKLTAIDVSNMDFETRVNDNFIGGSTRFCLGNPWIYNNQATAVDFKAISLNTSHPTSASVQGNTIRNIRFSNWGYTFYGIHISAASNATVGSSKANLIGDVQNNFSIQNEKGTSFGIWNLNPSTNNKTAVRIENNRITGISASRNTGIYFENYSGVLKTNFVSHLTASESAGFLAARGLHLIMETGEITGNEITDLVGSGQSGSCTGMQVTNIGTTLPLFINRNKISGLVSNSTLAGATITGIQINSYGVCHVQNNMIHLVNGSGTSMPSLRGLVFTNSTIPVRANQMHYNTIYIGGIASGSATSYGVLVNGEGTAAISSFANNLIYNERTGGAAQHIALGVQPSSGSAAALWGPTVSTNNLYISTASSAVNQWSGQVLDMKDWRNVTKGDSVSYAATVATVSASHLFTNLAGGDLRINNNDSLCWHVNGKGKPLTSVSSDIDSATFARSTSISDGATDIGCDEFFTSTLPLGLTIKGAHIPGSTDTLSFNERVIATIAWGIGGTLPLLGHARYFSGEWPNDIKNNGLAIGAQALNTYWQIPASGGNNYSYNLTLHYDSSILGKVTRVDSMVINKRQPGQPGSWVTLSPTEIDPVSRTVTIRNQNSFSEFTSTDKNATLSTGVPIPDLKITNTSVNPIAISTASSFLVSFTETNSGAALAGPHTIGIYLSSDNVLTPGLNGDTLIKTYVNPNPLPAGSTTSVISQQVLMPCNRPIGASFVFVMADPANTITETLETNNAQSIGINITTGIAQPAAPIITANPATSVCEGTTVLLAASSSNCASCTFIWRLNGAVLSTSPSITVGTSGLYSVVVSNACGTATAQQNIVINPRPSVVITSSATNCQGNPIVLTAAGADSYQWSGPGLTATIGASVTATTTGAGSYTYSVTGLRNGCTNVATSVVTVLPQLVPAINIAYSGCPSTTLTFTATTTNGGANQQVKWYLNSILAGSGNSFSYNNAVNGAQVFASLTSSEVCAAPLTLNSAPISVNCITTALPNIDGLESFVISPNPGNGYFKMAAKMNRVHRFSYTIRDISGRKILGVLPFTASGLIVREIDLRSYSSGLYFIEVVINKSVFVERLLIQK